MCISLSSCSIRSVRAQVLSCGHDGAVKLWDIRSTLPLHSAQAHQGKALCCGWHNGKIMSGGEDGEVKTYVVPERSND